MQPIQFPPNYEDGKPICPISEEPMQQPAQLNCGHIFDRANIGHWVARAHTCPTCRQDASERDIRSITLEEKPETVRKIEAVAPAMKKKVSDVLRFIRERNALPIDRTTAPLEPAALPKGDHRFVQQQIQMALFARPV